MTTVILKTQSSDNRTAPLKLTIPESWAGAPCTKLLKAWSKRKQCTGEVYRASNDGTPIPADWPWEAAVAPREAIEYALPATAATLDELSAESDDVYFEMAMDESGATQSVPALMFVMFSATSRDAAAVGVRRRAQPRRRRVLLAARVLAAIQRIRVRDAFVSRPRGSSPPRRRARTPLRSGQVSRRAVGAQRQQVGSARVV